MIKIEFWTVKGFSPDRHQHRQHCRQSVGDCARAERQVGARQATPLNPHLQQSVRIEYNEEKETDGCPSG